MIFDDVQKEEYKWYSYSERATLHQLSTKYCALYFEHFNVANTSDVRIKCCRGRRRRGMVVRLAGAVSQSLPSLCLGCDQCDHSRYGPGVMIRDSSQNTTFLIYH